MNEDKQAHLCDVLRFQNHSLVDAAGIGGRKKLLPGEALIYAIWRIVRESAEVIVVTENEQTPEKKGLKFEVLRSNEGLNIKMFQMQQGSAYRKPCYKRNS